VVAHFSTDNIIGLDLETTGLSPIDSKIILCQIGFRDHTYVIDTSKVDIAPLLPFFTSNRWKKIIQRSEFERKFIKKHHGVKINNVFDTWLAEKLITTDTKAPSSLAFLAKKYADMDLNKAVRMGFTEARAVSMFTEEELQYAADDVICLFPIYDGQSKIIREKSLDYIAEVEFECAQVVANMELVGVPILIDKWHSIIEETRREHEESRLRMNGYLFDSGDNQEQIGMFVRDSINLNSPKQITAAFANLGINVTSTAEREIALIDHPAAKELLKYRGLQKILSSYGESFLGHIHPFTGRIHADFLQLGTETGRFSCKEPNLQQMPDNFRQCVGGSGYSIIAADYSQIELRILAELSGDPNFLKAFTSGEDLHKSTAATMFNIDLDKVTKEQRFIAKTINFGLAYGMGSNKLMDILNAEAEKNGSKKYTQFQTKALVSKYRTAYRKVIDWLDEAGQTAIRKGYSETMLGRKRFFSRPAQGISEGEFDMQMAGIRRQGANAPIQGTNADITKLAMIEIDTELAKYGFSGDIIIQVHDEIVVLARKDQAENIKIIVVDAMIAAGEKVLKTVPVKVEAYISDVWKKG